MYVLYTQSTVQYETHCCLYAVNGTVITARFLERNQTNGTERNLGLPTSVILVLMEAAQSSSSADCSMDAGAAGEDSSIVLLLGEGRGMVLDSSAVEEVQPYIPHLGPFVLPVISCC